MLQAVMETFSPDQGLFMRKDLRPQVELQEALVAVVAVEHLRRRSQATCPGPTDRTAETQAPQALMEVLEPSARPVPADLVVAAVAVEVAAVSS